jgi:hypothetical protein
MSFPSLALPEDTVQLFSRPKPVKIRPYLVGEEKLLLMAQQAVEQDPESKEVEKAVKQIIKRCSFDVLDTDILPTFDVEWLFLQLRSKSVNNVITAQFRCIELVNGKKCDTLVPVNIDIADIKLHVPSGHSNKVMLDDTFGILLKYPTAASVSDDPVESLCHCLDAIYSVNGAVYEAKDQTR